MQTVHYYLFRVFFVFFWAVTHEQNRDLREFRGKRIWRKNVANKEFAGLVAAGVESVCGFIPHTSLIQNKPITYFPKLKESISLNFLPACFPLLIVLSGNNIRHDESAPTFLFFILYQVDSSHSPSSASFNGKEVHSCLKTETGWNCFRFFFFFLIQCETSLQTPISLPGSKAQLGVNVQHDFFFLFFAPIPPGI